MLCRSSMPVRARTDGTVLCCDATLVSPRTHIGQPHKRRKAAIYPEFRSKGPQRFSEVGRRFNSDAGVQSASGTARCCGFRVDAMIVDYWPSSLSLTVPPLVSAQPPTSTTKLVIK